MKELFKIMTRYVNSVTCSFNRNYIHEIIMMVSEHLAIYFHNTDLDTKFSHLEKKHTDLTILFTLQSKEHFCTQEKYAPLNQGGFLKHPTKGI